MSAILHALGYTVIAIFIAGMLAGCAATVVAGRFLAGAR
jgi:hypothetical protein